MSSPESSIVHSVDGKKEVDKPDVKHLDLIGHSPILFACMFKYSVEKISDGFS